MSHIQLDDFKKRKTAVGDRVKLVYEGERLKDLWRVELKPVGDDDKTGYEVRLFDDSGDLHGEVDEYTTPYDEIQNAELEEREEISRQLIKSAVEAAEEKIQSAPDENGDVEVEAESVDLMT